ncbi:MAG TPA: hypothetical protein VI341_01835 [Actinomycetota bacterium]
MSQVNLLPPEVLQSQRWRRLTMLVLALGGLALVVVIGFFLYQNNKLSGVEDEIAAQAATNASIQVQIDEKQQFADLQAEAQSKEELLATAYSGEVSYSSILMDVSRVMPADAYLDDLTSTITAGTAVDAGTAPPEIIGTLSGTGQAVSIDTVADLLNRLSQVDGWVNPWVTALVRSEDVNGYTYSVGVDLTQDVVTPRGKEAGVAQG